MIKCFQCSKECPDHTMILICADTGDFVCGKRCQRLYETEKKHFFNNIVHDAQKTEEWLLSKR